MTGGNWVPDRIPGRDGGSVEAEPGELVPGAETRESRKEVSKAGRKRHEAGATDLIRALPGSLRSYDDAYRKAEVDSPTGSVLDSAGYYAVARHKLDQAVVDGDLESAQALAVEVVHAGDQLAHHIAENPTSRIRPSFDRRPNGGKPASVPADVRRIEQVGTAAFRDGIPIVEATETDTGMLWALQQRVFHAKMDFLAYRVRKGLIAVDDIDVTLEVRLTVRTAPDKLGTKGRDIKLPADVHTVHYYEQPEQRWSDNYARTGHGGEEKFD